nr:hypothetical protein [uncultured Brevundimonas sp.]
MADKIRNPAALRLLIGWAVVAAVIFGGLAAAGFLPPHPGFGQVFMPAVAAVLLQGVVALMAAKQGRARLGWIILLAPPLAMLAIVALSLALFAFGVG